MAALEDPGRGRGRTGPGVLRSGSSGKGRESGGSRGREGGRQGQGRRQVTDSSDQRSGSLDTPRDDQRPARSPETAGESPPDDPFLEATLRCVATGPGLEDGRSPGLLYVPGPGPA